MGSDWAKNCTVAAIRNSDNSRILSLAILLMFSVPIVQRRLRERETPYCHVGAMARSCKVTVVMSFFSQGHGGKIRSRTRARTQEIQVCRRKNRIRQKVAADMTAAAGMVSSHVHTIRLATPQRTADNRWTAPTPTMAPVIVCGHR